MAHLCVLHTLFTKDSRGEIRSLRLEDTFDSGIRLSYRPPSICSLASERVRQPYARVDYISQTGTKNLATGCVLSHASGSQFPLGYIK